MNTITKTLQPIPYLSFDGNCAEAFDFYAELFGGKITGKMTYADMPMEMGMPDESKHLMMHEQLELPGGALLYGGDSTSCSPHKPMTGLMLALNFPTADQAQSVFDRLADGGEVSMPFEPSFWSEKFGMVTDKYGIHWAINGNLKDME
jgi:PhnB protein